MNDDNRQGYLNSLCGLLDSIEELCDRAFQDRVWLRGAGPEVSCYTEAMADVLHIRPSHEYAGAIGLECGLRPEQSAALGRFARQLTAFDDQLPDKHDDEAVVSHPEFSTIVELANMTVEICSDWRREHCRTCEGGLGQASR
jgi:hypothetical protein